MYVVQTANAILSMNVSVNPGNLDRLSIHPGRSMRVIATVIGPLKKHVGKFNCSLCKMLNTKIL